MKNILILSILLLSTSLYAKELPKVTKKKSTNTTILSKSQAPCAPATRKIELDVNNVRATLLNGGDMWWDLSDGQYIIPANGVDGKEVGAVFASSVWMGGIDAGGNLKLAAQTYRQTGHDFWPGPIDANGETDAVTCNEYDRMWSVKAEEIEALIVDFDDNGIIDNPIATSIRQWPGINNPHSSITIDQNMAPFFDRNTDGIYNPEDGDFPTLGMCTSSSEAAYADQMIFWIYNDVGDVHTETGGGVIGVEVKTMAFAWASSVDDPINNTTFYKHDIEFNTTTAIDSFYFGLWVDPDLGCLQDDFVGCDTSRNMGYVYNGDADDEDCGSNGYGSNPPLFGVNYIKTPTDQLGNDVGMTNFLYYSNTTNLPYGNPNYAQHYYNYLTGTWGDHTPSFPDYWTYGGDGTNQSNPRTNYFFSGNPQDPAGWSECLEENTAADRRFLMSSGSVDALPGSVYEIVYSAVWAEQDAPQVGCAADLTNLQEAADRSVEFYNSCFKLFRGPDAPALTGVSSDKKVTLTIDNSSIYSNNTNEDYEEAGMNIPDAEIDSLYKFQGYIIYQVKDSYEFISPNQITDTNICKPVAQFDIVDGVGTITNYVRDVNGVFQPVVMVNGMNTGLQGTFDIMQDAYRNYAPLRNNTDYYYTAVAYAYNNYNPFNPSSPDETTQQAEPFVVTRKKLNVETFTPVLYTDNGHPDFGRELPITRFRGRGNSGFFTKLEPDTREKIGRQGFEDTLKYQESFGPYKIIIKDPSVVQTGDYELYVLDEDTTDDVLSNQAYWVLKFNGNEYTSEYPINDFNEQDIPALGIAVEVRQVKHGVDAPSPDAFSNGYIGQEVDYLGASNTDWLTGATSGEVGFSMPLDNRDAKGEYSQNTWFPYTLANCDVNTAIITPAWISSNCTFVQNRNKLSDLSGIDIVFTQDQSLWSECVVIESGLDGVPKADANNIPYKRSVHPSWYGQVDGSGNPIYGNNPSDPTDMGGRSLFPGYAVNVETGERLNIFFGEDSFYSDEVDFFETTDERVKNGYDLIYNPSDLVKIDTVDYPQTWQIPHGGRHYVYVSNTLYDGCHEIDSLFTDVTNSRLRTIYQNISWTSMSYLQQGKSMLPINQGLVPSEAVIQLRVNDPFEVYESSLVNKQSNFIYPRYGFKIDALTSTITPKELNDVVVYPNPTMKSNGGILNINYLPESESAISIYSITGQLIKTVQKSASQQQISINVKDVSSGTYIINIVDKEGNSYSKKWIVMD